MPYELQMTYQRLELICRPYVNAPKIGAQYDKTFVLSRGRGRKIGEEIRYGSHNFRGARFSSRTAKYSLKGSLELMSVKVICRSSSPARSSKYHK